MNLKASFLYAMKIFFSRGTNDLKSHGKKSLTGALVCIAISLVPLVAVLVVTESMITGMTERMINLSTQDLGLFVDSDNDDEFSLESLMKLKKFASSFSFAKYVSAEIQGEALASAGGYRTGASVRGVEPSIFGEKGPFGPYLNVIAGTAAFDTSRSAVLGQKIAEQLGVKPGDSFTLISVNSLNGNVFPKAARFTVQGIISCGYQELDALWVFIPVETAFASLAKSTSNAFVGVKTDMTFSEKLSDLQNQMILHCIKSVDPLLNTAYIMRWDQMNASQFENFQSTKALLMLIMFLIVLVASINISSALVMLVMERKKEIAILKSVGATNGGITFAFMTTGFICGLGGTLIGIPVGILASLFINQIIGALEHVVNFFAKIKFVFVNHDASSFAQITLLNPDYYLTHIDVSIPYLSLLVIAFATLVLSLVMSFIPAFRAGKENPIDTLRKS